MTTGGPAPARHLDGPIDASLVVSGRTVSEPRLSPDASRVGFVASWGDRSAVAVVPVAGGPEVLLTTSPDPPRGRPLGGGSWDWLVDGTGVVAVGKGGLWLHRHGRARRIARHDEPVSCPVVSPDGARVAYVVGQRDVAVVGLGDDAGWPVRLSSGRNDFALDPSWSADGAFVVWHEWDVPSMPWDESRWVVAPSNGDGSLISYGEPHVSVAQPRFGPTGTDLAFVCDRSGYANVSFMGPSFDLDDPVLAEPFEHATPTWGGGNRSFAWSGDGSRLAFNRNEDGFGRLCVVELSTRQVTQVARGHHGGLHWVADRLVGIRSGGRTPPQVVAYDTARADTARADTARADTALADTGGWTRTVLARSGVAAWDEHSALVEPDAVRFASMDGDADLHGLLYRPSVPNRGLICWLHGGPTDQWTVTFNARVAYYVSRGWTVLAPNHRGSTGYGRAYAQQLHHGWGTVDVADTLAALRAAIEHDWARADRLVLMGGSAGGFTALGVLAAAPRLVRAAVVLYPVTDLTDNDTHRFEAHYFDTLVPAAHRRGRSPLRHAGAIVDPVLVLHGDADDVVSPEQVRAFGAQCPTAVIHTYPGEGHGWRSAATTCDELERTDAFLARHIPNL